MSRRRHKKHEEHQNHEAWAIPYGDLVTLLLAFFVVMYAVSSVNAGKYRVLSNALTAAFRGQPKSPQVITVGQEAGALSENMPINEVNRMFTAGMPAHMRMPLPQARGTEAHGQATPGSADPRDLQKQATEEFELARGAELDKMQEDVSGALGALARSNAVRITRAGNNIEVQIGSDLLFASGSAELAASAGKVLADLGNALKPWPNGVRVEGHTDDRPISTTAFRSNWELSAARAASVVKLFTDRGVDPARMSVIGYGQYRPVADNKSDAGRGANRRVVIVILGRESPGGASGAGGASNAGGAS